MYEEKIKDLLAQYTSPKERVSRLNYLMERHGVLLDRLKNNTDRPHSKKPGLWPCEYYDDIRLLLGPEVHKEIFDEVAQHETCHDRRAKLTLKTANELFHSQKPLIKNETLRQFEQFGNGLALHKATLECKQKKK